MRRLLATTALLAATAATPAVAQGGPSFDCAKASNAIDRAICKDKDLAKADREMVALYSALLGRLSGPAKEALQKGQVQWIVNRNRGCTGSDADLMTRCLTTRYENRIADLKASGTGTYPFVEEQTIAKWGKVGKVSYSIDISYPRFAGNTADFSAINRIYADNAAKGARESTPPADAGVDREQKWSAEGGYSLYRPWPDAVTVSLGFWAYTGGAHGYGSITCTLVDLRTGKVVPPSEVFVAGDRWLAQLVTMVAADLKKQFVENPGFDDALEPAKLAKTLRDGGHYCWQAGKLQIYFNQYEVGPYSSGPYTVDIPYATLKPLLREARPIAQ
ncbi:MAG: DUF3298 domain-containing protein [Reyranella sp.]|nr:DUF3298 domain-containing protein [Reyranella sp.]MDP3161266.1 DUF3298 domain-containing protein [Reyranella sp.]